MAVMDIYIFLSDNSLAKGRFWVQNKLSYIYNMCGMLVSHLISIYPI